MQAVAAEPKGALPYVALCTATGRLALFSDNRSKAALVKVTFDPCCSAGAMQLPLRVFLLHTFCCLLVGSARTSPVSLNSTLLHAGYKFLGAYRPCGCMLIFMLISSVGMLLCQDEPLCCHWAALLLSAVELRHSRANVPCAVMALELDMLPCPHETRLLLVSSLRLS